MWGEYFDEFDPRACVDKFFDSWKSSPKSKYHQLIRYVELVLREDVIAKGDKKNQSLKLAVIALSIALLIMLAGNFGLTAAVVYMTKDTEVNGNVLTDIHGTPLATASTDMTIASDKMTGATALVSKATNEAVSVHAIDGSTLR